MNYQIILGSIAILLTIVQYSTYVKDVLRKNTHPHAFSWFVWGFPCGVVFFAQFFDGGGAGTWTTALTTIFCTAIFILSLFYGEKTITKLDWMSLIVAFLSIILWIIVKGPLISVVLITFIDVVGFIPTVRKSINKPHEETLSCYGIGGLKWTASLLAMSNFSLIVLLYPATMIIANWGFGGILLLRRFYLEQGLRKGTAE